MRIYRCLRQNGKTEKPGGAGKPEVVPMYDMNDALGVLTHFVPCEYEEKVEVCDGITIRFQDAGHLLGSSFIEIWLKEEGEELKLIFSGDLGNGNRPLLRGSCDAG